MNHRLLRVCAAIPIAGILVFASAAQTPNGVKTARAFDITKINKALRGHISGFAAYELDPANSTSNPSSAGNYFPRGSDSCPVNLSSNIKVNQNCLNVSDSDLQGRGQSQNETSIAQDPNNPNHMIGTYNDYRRGDGNCYGSYSLDKGRTWNDTTIPMSFTRGHPGNILPTDFGKPRQYWQAGGDTSIAWDSKGNAYFSCQVFNRGNAVSNNQDQSSAMLVFRSTQNNGASWNFPGRYVTAENDIAGSGTVLEDKQLIGADSNSLACPSSQTTVTPGSACSPFQDRVYVTWTEFTLTTAYIYEAFSNDYGETFSPRHVVSPTGNNSVCPVSLTAGNGCDNNQFSQPFVARDGTLYVLWANYNTVDFSVPNPAPAKYQVLISKSLDGGNTFTPPQKGSDFYELPDCATYQDGNDPGRACVPEKGGSNSVFRATNYPVGAVNPTNPNIVAVSIGSYINAHSNEANGCVPTGSDPLSTGGLYTGVKVPGACNNDILLSLSTNGGATFSGTGTDPRLETTVTQDPAQATTDQWFQWLAFNKQGKLAVSYYDRQYGTDETTGFSDFSLSGSGDYAKFAVLRVTSGSMPPPTQFSGTFWGDYTGLTAVDNAYPFWSDTRDPDLFVCPGTATPGAPPALCGHEDFNGPANDQDVFTAALPVPSR
ncbi:MAG: exo-alpha-sialidase [Chloroflexi bacterium]|nr:MAG: exo-alpha-sialidase [Chloroflexota bacterium]